MDNKDQETTRRRPLSHAQFYKACEMMKENRGVFMEQKPTLPQGAVMLSRMCGFDISPYAFGEVREAVGLEWQPKTQRKKLTQHEKSARGNAIRCLTVSVRRLYQKMGEEVPESLETLWRAVACYSSTEEQLEQARRELDEDPQD